MRDTHPTQIRSRWRSSKLAVVLIGLEAAVLAQAPQFRARADLVVLDVSVFDRNRRPVEGLTASDFTVLEDGAPQSIVTFETVRMPAQTSSAAWMQTAAFDVQSNRTSAGRLVVILFDDQSGGYVRMAQAVGRSVIEQLGEHDLCAVVFLDNASKGQDFTNDKGRLLAAVDRFTFDPLFAQPIKRLAPLVDALAAVPDRRKLVVYLSSGYPYDPVATATAVRAGSPGVELSLQLFETFNQIQDLFRRAQRANVNFYAVDLKGLTAPRPTDGGRDRDQTDFLRMLSTETGGSSIVATNAPETQVPRIFDENRDYYLIGYQATRRSTPGRYRRLEVKVNGRDLDVRTRRGYVSPQDADVVERPVDAALTALLPNPELPLLLAAAPFAGDVPGTAILSMAVGLQAPRGDREKAEEVDLTVAVLGGPDGKLLSSTRHGLRVTPQANGPEPFRYQFLHRLELKPGNYSIRVSAHSQTQNKTGSLFADVLIPDFARESISLSGIIIAQVPGPVSVPKDPLAGLPTAVPTTSREFSTVDRATAFVRVYQGGQNTLVPVALDVSILDDSDRAVWNAATQLATERFSKNRAAEHQFVVPLNQLRPGAHLLRLTATLPNRKATTRTVRISVR